MNVNGGNSESGRKLMKRLAKISLTAVLLLAFLATTVGWGGGADDTGFAKACLIVLGVIFGIIALVVFIVAYAAAGRSDRRREDERVSPRAPVALLSGTAPDGSASVKFGHLLVSGSRVFFEGNPSFEIPIAWIEYVRMLDTGTVSGVLPASLAGGDKSIVEVKARGNAPMLFVAENIFAKAVVEKLSRTADWQVAPGAW